MSELPCRMCEELLGLYLDGELADEEVREAEEHLDACGYCRRNYRYERLFRTYMRQAISEPIPPELTAKLASLRTGADPADSL
jgi:predicted anti-sigma-YlaC factor YlaD